MSRKQWGHGFRTGVRDGREEMSDATAESSRVLQRIWVAENLCDLIKSKLCDYEKEEFDDLRFLFLALEDVHRAAVKAKIELLSEKKSREYSANNNKKTNTESAQQPA